jgi:hypothetical protein
MPVAKGNLDFVFAHHAPDEAKIKKHEMIRSHAAAFAFAILEMTPQCADQQAALRLVREAMMTANAAIALDGAV